MTGSNRSIVGLIARHFPGAVRDDSDSLREFLRR